MNMQIAMHIARLFISYVRFVANPRFLVFTAGLAWFKICGVILGNVSGKYF